MADDPATYLSAITEGPPDGILGIAQNFKACTAANKVNLVIGAYRTEEGEPWVLPSVKAAEQRLIDRNENKEYATQAGVPAFVEHAMRFAYGDASEPLKSGCVAAVQALSGTGALWLASQFYLKFLPAGTEVHISDPSWGNHAGILKTCGIPSKPYRYLDRASQTLDFDGMLADINAAAPRSVFLLHACAHNPTGIDPTPEQWSLISKAIKATQHHVLMDSAYQGFASGDAEADASALRSFVADGHSLLLAQSFAKNFGLYGERTGTLSVVCRSPAEAKAVLSQLKILVRTAYSSPPIHGAKLVAEVLGDAALSAQYYKECASMASRIKEMRSLLRAALTTAGSTLDWSHIVSQIGMFAFTGLSPEEVDALAAEHNVFCTRDGRFSMAGVNSKNVEYIAKCVHAVTKARA
jgi:aspartate aminotransferase